MPSLNVVEEFVSLVEAGRGIDALDRFYAENASMQENESTPRVGKEALLMQERAAQAAVSELKAICVRPVLIADETVVIRWIFEYLNKGGKRVRFEELAYQQWKDDVIVAEKFFYDPAQFA